MSDADFQQHLGRVVTTLRIIVDAMAAGLVIFLIVAVVIVRSNGSIKHFGEGPPIVTYVAIATAVINLLVRMVIPRIVVTTMRRKLAQAPPEGGSEATELLKIYHVRTVICSALIEGPALFTVVAYMTEASLLAVYASILLAVILASHWPTRSGVMDWVDQQQHQLEQERMGQP